MGHYQIAHITLIDLKKDLHRPMPLFNIPSLMHLRANYFGFQHVPW